MVRIEHYEKRHIADPDGNASFQQFHEARNAVLRACKLHGPSGPMGFFPFDAADDEDVLLAWMKTADPNPAYWLIDDQYNAERYQYVECTDPKYFTEGWVRDLMAALSTLSGWGVAIKSIPGGYALVFADKIMVTGNSLENVHDLSSFIASVHEALRNKDRYVKKGRSGECKEYWFENDRLICKVEWFFDEGAGELQIARKDVEKLWRHPFEGIGMLSLEDDSMIRLPGETAFAAISEWLGAPA
jgi:hypothetical protein